MTSDQWMEAWQAELEANRRYDTRLHEAQMDSINALRRWIRSWRAGGEDEAKREMEEARARFKAVWHERPRDPA